ncbi:DUF1801 domain-containing protein [Metasolibacillus meyeri]|uniref:DUF1801 domain-containing protein n=1 Tax=Metasolibacillus meyeri TaxID=1071052 RepID=UPI001EE6CD66|nr:DUF1801 domain-containing protein [Metasolibacillus meyeri]
MTNPKVDEFLNTTTTWKQEFELLREIVLDSGLTEDFKWKHPCYTLQNKNIVLIHGFKEYCALLFHQGALLADLEGILVQQTEKVQAARQIRFKSLQEIQNLEPTIKAYINEAIKVEEAGLKVEVKKGAEVEMPEELQSKFAEDTAFQEAFEALTPGRRREYIYHFTQAKQSKTKTARIEKNMSRILAGKGLRDCVCGFSKRMPTCDGSHKYH